ncbi:MAG TPA: threonine synthase [Planctomycetota bacterium]|nr:threonine synthase [Planctomycetota bacterium]
MVTTRSVCPACGAKGGPDLIRCAACGDLVEVRHERESAIAAGTYREALEARRGSRERLDRSGVWRFRELVAPTVADEHVVSLPEGNTPLYESERLGRWVGLSRPLLLKHEGMNPTGSFKDRGMTVGVSVARSRGARAVACASTGNTSASLAAYAARAGMRGVVFIPEGKIASGKLAQTLAYGARVVQVRGSFDRAMALVEEAAGPLGLYLLNSVNPWRIEGQKAIPLEILDDLGWTPPDWIALPAGNLGNTSAFGKALREAKVAGLIAHAPRLASIQAEGASPFARLWRSLRAAGADLAKARLDPEPRPETVATAIRIGDPRSWRKALIALAETDGVCDAVSDAEILDAKAMVDADGIGCEPGSAASVAGVKKLVAAGTIAKDARVVCVLTGHVLKDPETTWAYHTGEKKHALANVPVQAPDTIDGLRAALARDLA